MTSYVLNDLMVVPTEYALSRPFHTALRNAYQAVPACDVLMRFDDRRLSKGIAVPVEEVTGESFGMCLAALSGPIREHLIGRDLSRMSIAGRLADAVSGVPAASSGVEMAWRATSEPQPKRIAVMTDATVSLDSTDAACDQAVSWVDSGFTHLKMKADSRPDIDRYIESIAAAVPGATLRIDPNQSWSFERAVKLLDRLHNSGVAIDFIEQPLPTTDHVGIEALCAESPFPIAADESACTVEDIPKLADLGIAVVIIKIGKTGGWTLAHAMAVAAKRLGMTVVVSSMLEPLPCIVEAARLAQQVAPEQVHDLDAALFFVEGQDAYQPPYLAI